MTDERGVRDSASLLKTSPDIALAYKRSTVREGDIVCSIGPSYGKVMLVPQELSGANLTQGTARVSPDYSRISGRFLFWVLRSELAKQQWDSAVGGATFRALNLGPLGETRVPYSQNLDWQYSVARFLDRETARIDALIEKKQRLIELLKEKRQAVITKAVTKGLDPSVPMKDSGVEWLRQVPAHWDVISLRWLIRIGSGDFLSNTEFSQAKDENNTIPVIGGNGLTGFSSLYNAKDAVVIGRVGALCGNAHYIQSKCWITDNALHLRQACQLSPEFLLNALLMLDLNRIANQNAQPLVTGEMVKAQKIGIPPVEEQTRIHEFIAAELQRLDGIMSKTRQTVGLLQERRSALITAAVTGQIDVRDAA